MVAADQEPARPGQHLLADHLTDPTHPLLHHHRREVPALFPDASLCAAVCLFCGLVWLSPELAVAVSLEQQQRWVSTATPLDTCGARFRDLLTL